MIKLLFKSLIFFFSIFTIIISYLTFVSFRYQRMIGKDFDNNEVSLSMDQIEKVPFIPNISITTIPIKSMISKYYIDNGEIEKAFDLLKEGSLDNPYIYYSDYLLANYFLQAKIIDSAYYYSKKAFYGWPKNIMHYEFYNKVLSIKKDTIEIFEAYKFINKVFNSGQAHHNSFIDSYTNAKLSYLKYEYEDSQSINLNQIIGQWQQIYEFEGGKLNKLNNFFKIDKDYFYSGQSKYNYDFKNDTLNLYFTTNNKLVSSIPIKYSPSFETLIFKNVIRDTNSDNPERQDKFYKKIK